MNYRRTRVIQTLDGMFQVEHQFITGIKDCPGPWSCHGPKTASVDEAVRDAKRLAALQTLLGDIVWESE